MQVPPGKGDLDVAGHQLIVEGPHEVSVGLVGADGALADAQIIALAATTLDSLGITGYVITIGNVGILSDVLGRLGLTGRRRAIPFDAATLAGRGLLQQCRGGGREGADSGGE